MHQVKAIRALSLENLENNINEFLKSNPNIKLVDVKMVWPWDDNGRIKNGLSLIIYEK